MNDRLNELRNIDISSSRDFTETELVEVPIDIDLSEVPAGLQNFTDHVDRIKLSIGVLKSNIQTLNTQYRSMLLSTGLTSQEEATKTLENQIEASIKAISVDLKDLDAQNKVATDHARWRTNIHTHVTKSFMDVMMQYREAQAVHQSKTQERIKQQLQIVKPDATPEEIQNVINDGKLNVFADKMKSENLQQARDALTYVEGRHRELLKIEASVEELQRLFNDMAILVTAQGEFVDNIEANVAQSGAYIEQANRDLVQANRRKSKRRWCMFWSCLIFLILIAIGVIVFITIGKQNGFWGLSK